MTSTNDGKDVKSNLTSGPRGKKYHIELYKSLEAHLSSEETLEERTRHVSEAWRRVYSLHLHSAPSTHPHLLSWLQRHTALTILQSEWQSSPNKDELHDCLSAAIDELVSEAGAGTLPWQQQLLARARWFRAALASPWGHPVLTSLLNDAGEALSDQQVLEWLKEERGVVFVSRLRQLAASKRTNDLALALAGAVMDRARASRPPAADDADEPAIPEDDTSFYAVLRRDAGFLEVWDLLTDIEFVLLHRREKRARCIELAKQTPLRDGYHLVERLRSRLETSPRDKKLWKNAKDVATLIAQVIIARCMVLTTCAGAGRAALYCCARSLARLVAPVRLPAVTAALAAPAATARHLHTLCSAVHAQCTDDMKPFVCELYVRAITAGMNELERLKLNPEKGAEARSAEQTLASWFTQLGALLSASERLRAECALTAFSVHPAPDMYERVRRARPPPAARRPDRDDQASESTSAFGSWANDSRTQSNLVKTSETLQLKPVTGQTNVLSTAILTEGEALGLAPELGQDLAVLLAGPRLKTLSWDMDRELLLDNCRAHMDRTHGGTRALTTELKYLNLDPRAFQHLPEEGDDENDLYYGIEKGYEHLVQLEEPEEIWQKAFFDPEQTESANESELELYANGSRKAGALPSSEDEDPLSLIADAKKQAKKEKRSQSRERKGVSKERRKKTERDTSKDGTRERRKDKKPKKERKKKSDPTIISKIDKLPKKDGQKRSRKKKERRREDLYTNKSVTDSDYDSQGKASQLSDNNDAAVLFDGVFSMDGLKSPERRQSSEKPKDSSPVVNSSSPTVINKIISTPSPAISKPVLETVKHTTKVKSSASSDSDVSRSRSPYLTPTQLSNRHAGNDKVKRSITKLLQFRRQKNAAVPKSSSGQRTDKGPSPVNTQPAAAALNEAPKVNLDKKQTQQLEAMNNLINAAKDIKTSDHMRKITNEPAKECDISFTSPQNSPQKNYNIQKQQEAMQYVSQNIAQNPNVFSDRHTYSDYTQSSPHKYSPYSNYMANQPARPSSVINTSYTSQTKQIDRFDGPNLTLPKTENILSHQKYHKSMQNLTQVDSNKPSAAPKQQNEPRYYHHYTNNKQHNSSQRVQVTAPEKNMNHLQSPSSTNSIQQQYAAISRANNFVKSYQTLADNRINPPSSSYNTQASCNFSSPKQLTNSMQNILNDTLSAVSNDFRKISVPQGALASHTSTQYGMNARSDDSNAQRDFATYAKQNSQPSLKQYSKPTKLSNTNAPAKPQVKTQISDAESQTKFKEFLKELQDTINAGVNDSGCFSPIVLNEQVKVTPVNSLNRNLAATVKDASAKQPKPMKKTETAPNTFSRLSYMHKNKQSEMKNQNKVDSELNKLNMNILDHKTTKAKFIKNEVTISRVQKPVNNSGNVQCNLQKKNPVLSSMLNAGSVEPYKGVQVPSVITNPSQTNSDSMTAREHADLLLLLRNQQTLKVPNVSARVPLSDGDLFKQNVSNLQTKANTQASATYQRSNDSHAALTSKKAEPAIVHNPQVAKESVKMIKDNQQDWQIVMNAIRAHKTRPLGPNALDIVLNKDKKPTQSTSKSHLNHEQSTPSPNIAQNNSEQRKSGQHYSRCNSSTRKPSIEKHISASKTKTQTEVIKKTPQMEVPKKPHAPNKHFTPNRVKQDDPFISGIPNSDYDLLEELMDDDLRQEIGELSSDEEKYQAPAVTKVKDSNVSNNVCAKNSDPPKSKPHVADPKEVSCKNAPCLNVPNINCTRTMNASSSTRYTNVIVNSVLPDVTNRLENRPTVLCSNIEAPHVANIITNQPENHFIANITPSNHIEPANLIITSVPTQPMVLISQGLVYDPYPMSAGLCNVTPNAYVTLNPAPNIAVYQTTQFAAPVINPVIIGNAMTTTTNVTNTMGQHPKPSLDKEGAQAPVQNSILAPVHNAPTEDLSKTAEGINSDINMNKCSERKVLYQMLDNNTINNVDKDVFTRLTFDNISLKSKQDEERIKMKRQALMNREINHPCFHPPIPLSYTPLFQKLNFEKFLEQSKPKNGAVKTSLKLRSSSTVVKKDVTGDTKVETPKCDNLNNSDQSSSTKENLKKSRRISLRSTNKIENKKARCKIVRVPLCRHNLKPIPTQSSDKDVTSDSSVKNETKTVPKTATRISQRIINKTIAKVDVTESNTKHTTDSDIEVQENKKENCKDGLNSEPGLIDFESTITASKILTTVSSKRAQEIVKEVVINPTGNARTSKDKVAQVSLEKSAIVKEETLVSDSTTGSIESAKIIEKLKSNLGNEVIIKSSAVNPTSIKEPIVMTIKNKNQAILANNAATTNIHISQPVNSKIAKNNAVVKTTASQHSPAKSVDSKIAKDKAVQKATEPEIGPMTNILLNKSVNKNMNISHVDGKLAKDSAIPKATKPEIVLPNTILSNKSVATNSNILQPVDSKIAKSNAIPKYIETEMSLVKPVLSNNSVVTKSNILQPVDSKFAKHNAIPKSTEPETVPMEPILANKTVATNSNILQSFDSKIAMNNAIPKSTKLEIDSVKPILPNKSVTIGSKIVQSVDSKVTGKNAVLKTTHPEIAPAKTTLRNNSLATNTNLQLGGSKIYEDNVIPKPTQPETAPSISVLSNKSVTANTRISQPIDSRMSKTNAVPETTEATAAKKSVVENRHHNLDAKHVNHTECLQNLQQKDNSATSIQNNVDVLTNTPSLKPSKPQQQVLSDSVLSLTEKKYLLDPTKTPDKDAAKETPSVIYRSMAKHNRRIMPMNSETPTITEEKCTNTNPLQINQKPSTNTITRPNKSIVPKTTNPASNPANSLSRSDNGSKNAQELRKEDVVIEEIPITGNQDPNKKCVRIKLPNGKVFKATVRGSIHVDYDTLFAEPAMRAILTEGLNDGKRYTLNIKQVSKTVKDNPTKILDTKIREISIKEKEVPIDTVNLISDDEEDDTILCFSTEFGKFSANIDLETLKIHQKQFDKKCTVKLFRDDIFKSNRTKPKPKSYPSTPISLLTRTKSKLVSELQNTTVTAPQVQTAPVNLDDDLPPVYLNGSKPFINEQHVPVSMLLKTAFVPKETIPEIIELDDSSSDGESRVSLNCTEPNLEPVEKINELKNLLLKDFGVVDKNKDKPTTIPLPEKETAVENLKSALLDDLGVSVAAPKQTEKQQNDITTKSKDKSDESYQTLKKIHVENCFVKIEHCDDLVEKYELIRNAKNCFVKLQRHNFSLGVMTDAIKCNKINKSESTEPDLDTNEDIIDFDVEETCSPQLSRCPSLSILNTLWDDTCSASAEHYYDRSSPVMEVFDALVSLQDKPKDKVDLVERVEKLKLWICESEWTMTKHAYSVQEMLKSSYIKENRRLSSDCKDNEQRTNLFKAPTLVTIAFRFLEDNPDLIYRLNSIDAVENKSLTNKQSNNLKRKTEYVDNNVACKILKLGSLVINAINNYCENIDKKSTDNYRNDVINIKADVILDLLVKQNENGLNISEVENDCYNDLLERSPDMTVKQDKIICSQNDEIEYRVGSFEYTKQSKLSNHQCVVDRDLVLRKADSVEKTKENLKKIEDDLSGNIEDSSDLHSSAKVKEITKSLINSNHLDVVLTPNVCKETIKVVHNVLETESVLIKEVDKIEDKLRANQSECELSKTASDNEKPLSSDKISEPKEDYICSISNWKIKSLHTCTSFDDQDTSATVKTVNVPMYDIKVCIDITEAISGTVDEMQPNHISIEEKLQESNRLSPISVEINNEKETVGNIITADCGTNIKSIENNATGTENANEKHNIEAPEVKLSDVEDQSRTVIDGARYVNNIYSETRHDKAYVTVNLDDSGFEYNEYKNAENSNQKCAMLDSYDTVKYSLTCSTHKEERNLINLGKLTQNFTNNESVPIQHASLDNETNIDRDQTQPALNNFNKATLDDTLVEIPFGDIPHEAYEVEIIDTSVDDTVGIQNRDPADAQKTIPSTIDTAAIKSDDCEPDLTSPIFIDNKEIVFNYHDYTKKPKISDYHTNAQSNQHTTKQKIHVENTYHQSSALKANEEDNSSTTKTGKVENPVIPTKPERKYELIQEDDWLTVITTEHDNNAPSDTTVDTRSRLKKSDYVTEETEIVTTPDIGNTSGVTLDGIEIEDPVIGTCYVFALNQSGSSESNASSENIDNCQESNDENAILYNNLHDIDFCVIAPKITYSRGSLTERCLKRKMDMRDIKVTAKKYRKSKNIDCSRQTVTSIMDAAYSKEYKRLLEYCSSVKFSYSRPFHKECVEVDDMTTNWPIKSTCTDVPQDEPDFNLFVDMHSTPAYQPNPTTQTLLEEITHEYEKTDTLQEYPSVAAYETNFDMGFGEGSGRVIQNLKEGGGSNISAATLSDVKQAQPVLSEYHDNCTVLNSNNDDQLKKIRQYVSFIELRDKVRSYFKKSSVELKLEWMQQNFKECGLKSKYSDNSVNADFPYDLCSLDYVKPTPTETTVQVVQLGQLPVSAAAQNPVTCDPRVTQVSDASPSQCSVDNSPNDDSQSEIKTEYTELTTADLTLPLVQDYAQQNQVLNLDSHDPNNLELTEQTISLEMEIKAEERPEIKEELPDIKEEGSNSVDNADLHTLTNATPENIEYMYDNNTAKPDSNNVYDSVEQNSSETFSQQRQQNGSTEKTDQIAHAMSAAGITTMPESLNNARAHALVNILSQKIRQGSINTTQTTTNTYSKTTSINAMALQQALAQILPPPLNQTGTNENNQTPSAPVGPQVLHIVQGKNASGNQITLVDNSQQSVISTPNATQVLHIVQNKGAPAGQTSNGTLGQPNSFSGLSLVDAGLQQGGNQLLHIVNTGNQKTANAGQLLKRVNLLTNLANVQGSNEQKMVQFVCKSADGKPIQLNAPHQRSMVLRLQPIDTSNVQTPPAKPAESQELTPSPTNSVSNKETANQQEIKSRSIYEENYAKFIQNSSGKPSNTEKSTSLPKFNQAFGKAVFQEGTQKQSEGTNTHMSQGNSENAECPQTDNAINLETMRQMGSPPLLIRKPPAVTTQSQPNIVQQIKQTIAPMNIQTMHGGVIYTRQIPVNIGGGQTINLITVPSTELINEESSKPQTTNQSDGEHSIIKILPQNQNTTNAEGSQEENNISATNDTPPTPQPQPVLTQMRIKLPMLSKAPQMVPGARVVRPSFFQIQRNVIGGANQPVYQQLVLTAAPPLGQQTIRLPQAQASRPIKAPSEGQSSSSESQMSSSTLEQLREFDMVLEQVKERSTVQPGTNSNNSTFKLQNNSSDATDGTGSSNCSNESTQVLYSIGNNQSLNVAYVNRKATVTTPTTSTFVRSPDSTGIADSPTSSTHVQIPHTVTSDSSPTEMTSQSKPAKVGSKSKSRPKSSSNPPNTLKLNSVPPKTSSQKPLEDEQTTQRILYILAEYKEQVENSPDKDKPAPRRRSNPPSNPGSSKRKKSSSSRRSGTRDMSPVHGEDTCRTMGSEDSSCGTSQGDCNESCLDSHSPQDSPRKVARKITFDQELPASQPRQPQRNVIVADGQTITVARSATGKPATAVLMPANYILPVSMVKGGQQIAIVTNRGPKLLTVGGEAGAANALLLQRLIGPGGLKPVLARPGVRHVRLPTAALHNLQAFNVAAAQPPDSSASPTPGPTPPELVDTRATSSPWTDRDDVKPERGSSPEGSEPWNLPSSADAHEYTYEETVRTDNMERTVLDPVPGRYSPDMEAQRIFDKMFDVEKKSYVDSPRCAYDIDASDGDDKAYQVVQKKDGTHRQHRLAHVSAAALRHKYAILEHELRLQKSLSEECEDLGVDSPSASELFPEAELLFAASPAPEHAQEHDHAPPPHQSTVPQPDLDDQMATDQLLPLGDDAPLDHEEFARAHPNTTFHSEPDEVQPFTITGLKGRHITSTIFHSNSVPATVLMAAPQASVIAQPDVKYDIDNMITMPPSDVNLSSVLVKDDGLTRFDSILTDSRELHLTNTASAIVHSSGNATQVIRRVCYEDDKRDRDARYLIDEPDNVIAGDDAKMVAEDSSRDATLESMADVDDDGSSPERHAELFWESNSASERSESRRPLDFSSDSDKCCKSPFDETNSTDSSGAGAHMRLDTVIKEARARERSGSAGSSDDVQPPLRTYPAKRAHAPEQSVSGKTRAGARSPGADARRRASGRAGRLAKRGCPCCAPEPPARAKKPRQRRPALDFAD